MRTFSLLIVGAGKIGAFFDTPQSDAVLTHAHAFSRHPGFRLIGFVDADRRQAESAAEIWGGEAFDSVNDAFARMGIDVAVVAAPDDSHCQLLQELAAYPLKLVFAEKPLAKTLAEAERIAGLYRECGVPLAMNYSRRYVPEFAALRDRIDAEEFGRFLTGTGYYGKGTLHNGSHVVDLLRFLLGEVSATTTLGGIRDWRDDDPSCSAFLELERGGSFVMQPLDCRCYTVFEMDLFFERSRVRLVDAGFVVEMQEVRSSEVYDGYRVLSGGETYATSLGGALTAAAASLYNHLTTGVPLPCTGDDGVRALEVCCNIIGGLR